MAYNAENVNRIPTGCEHLFFELDYDPATGTFSWKNQGPGRRVSGLAGNYTDQGYVQIGLRGKKYFAHRLAWLFTYREWPSAIDHINGDRCDNRIANLRIATATQNSANQRLSKRNKSGVKGVCWNSNLGRWEAFAKVNGRRKRLGLFLEKDDARLAYEKAARAEYGEFARPEMRNERA